ncbi:unnamed protein product [Amoebophrya sp. A25]|nr:unnamed protein product [Amoebophrya sp. A25]|eukprot:GSA25T00010453001.1
MNKGLMSPSTLLSVELSPPVKMIRRQRRTAMGWGRWRPFSGIRSRTGVAEECREERSQDDGTSAALLASSRCSSGSNAGAATLECMWVARSRRRRRKKWMSSPTLSQSLEAEEEEEIALTTGALDTDSEKCSNAFGYPILVRRCPRRRKKPPDDEGLHSSWRVGVSSAWLWLCSDTKGGSRPKKQRIACKNASRRSKPGPKKKMRRHLTFTSTITAASSHLRPLWDVVSPVFDLVLLLVGILAYHLPYYLFLHLYSDFSMIGVLAELPNACVIEETTMIVDGNLVDLGSSLEDTAEAGINFHPGLLTVDQCAAVCAFTPGCSGVAFARHKTAPFRWVWRGELYHGELPAAEFQAMYSNGVGFPAPGDNDTTPIKNGGPGELNWKAFNDTGAFIEVTPHVVDQQPLLRDAALRRLANMPGRKLDLASEGSNCVLKTGVWANLRRDTQSALAANYASVEMSAKCRSTFQHIAMVGGLSVGKHSEALFKELISGGIQGTAEGRRPKKKKHPFMSSVVSAPTGGLPYVCDYERDVAYLPETSRNNLWMSRTNGSIVAQPVALAQDKLKPMHCYKICANTPDCTAVTYDMHTKDCFLKSAIFPSDRRIVKGGAEGMVTVHMNDLCRRTLAPSSTYVMHPDDSLSGMVCPNNCALDKDRMVHSNQPFVTPPDKLRDGIIRWRFGACNRVVHATGLNVNFEHCVALCEKIPDCRYSTIGYVDGSQGLRYCAGCRVRPTIKTGNDGTPAITFAKRSFYRLPSGPQMLASPSGAGMRCAYSDADDGILRIGPRKELPGEMVYYQGSSPSMGTCMKMCSDPTMISSKKCIGMAFVNAMDPTKDVETDVSFCVGCAYRPGEVDRQYAKETLFFRKSSYSTRPATYMSLDGSHFDKYVRRGGSCGLDDTTNAYFDLGFAADVANPCTRPRIFDFRGLYFEPGQIIESEEGTSMDALNNSNVTSENETTTSTEAPGGGPGKRPTSDRTSFSLSGVAPSIAKCNEACLIHSQCTHVVIFEDNYTPGRKAWVSLGCIGVGDPKEQHLLPRKELLFGERFSPEEYQESYNDSLLGTMVGNLTEQALTMVYRKRSDVATPISSTTTTTTPEMIPKMGSVHAVPAPWVNRATELNCGYDQKEYADYFDAAAECTMDKACKIVWDKDADGRGWTKCNLAGLKMKPSEMSNYDDMPLEFRRLELAHSTTVVQPTDTRIWLTELNRRERTEETEDETRSSRDHVAPVTPEIGKSGRNSEDTGASSLSASGTNGAEEGSESVASSDEVADPAGVAFITSQLSEAETHNTESSRDQSVEEEESQNTDSSTSRVNQGVELEDVDVVVEHKNELGGKQQPEEVEVASSLASSKSKSEGRVVSLVDEEPRARLVADGSSDVETVHLEEDNYDLIHRSTSSRVESEMGTSSPAKMIMDATARSASDANEVEGQSSDVVARPDEGFALQDDRREPLNAPERIAAHDVGSKRASRRQKILDVSAEIKSPASRVGGGPSTQQVSFSKLSMLPASHR